MGRWNDDYDEFQWYNPRDWFGGHDEESIFKSREANEQARLDAEAYEAQLARQREEEAYEARRREREEEEREIAEYEARRAERDARNARDEEVRRSSSGGGSQQAQRPRPEDQQAGDPNNILQIGNIGDRGRINDPFGLHGEESAFKIAETNAVIGWAIANYGIIPDRKVTRAIGDAFYTLGYSPDDIRNNANGVNDRMLAIFEKSYLERGEIPSKHEFYQDFQKYQRAGDQNANFISERSLQSNLNKLEEEKARQEFLGGDTTDINTQIKEAEQKVDAFNQGKSFDEVKEATESGGAKIPGFEHVFRLAKKYSEDPDSLTESEKNLLHEGKQELVKKLESRSFLENVFGSRDEDIKAGLAELSTGLLSEGIEEDVLAQKQAIFDKYFDDLKDSEGFEDEALDRSDDLVDDEIKRSQELQKRSNEVRDFYQDRLGVSDSLHDEGIQQARDYANSPSIAAETLRRTLDQQVENQALAYDASNRRFGTGANLADINRQRQARDIDFANRAGVLAMQEQQSKQAGLATALTEGAKSRIGLADFNTLRGFNDDYRQAGNLASSAKLQGIQNLQDRGLTSTARAARIKDSQILRQTVGQDDLTKYFGDLGKARDTAVGKNWQAVSAGAGAASAALAPIAGPIASAIGGTAANAITNKKQKDEEDG